MNIEYRARNIEFRSVSLHPSKLDIPCSIFDIRDFVKWTKSTLLSIILMVWLVGCGPQPLTNLNGTLLDPPMEVVDFGFNAVDGTGDGGVQMSDFLGKYVIMAFGYTFCPDVCPTTMSRLVQTIDKVGEDADQIQVLLVTLDPVRDTPAQLKTYMQAFNPDFLGVSVTSQDSALFFKTFGIYSERPDPTATEDYLIDHSTSTIVLDPQGRWRLVWNFELQPDAMASDLKKLIRYQPKPSRPLNVSDVWMRPYNAEAGLTSAIYLTITNSTPSPVRLTGAAIAQSDTVEIHRSFREQGFEEQGIMRMRPVSSVVIEANSSLTFEPAGHHMMVKGLQQSLAEGDPFEIVLSFEGGKEIKAAGRVMWE